MSVIIDFMHEHLISSSVVKAAPPVGVSTLTLMGYNMSNLLVMLTIIYTSCLLFVLIRDKFVNHYSKDSKIIEEEK